MKKNLKKCFALLLAVVMTLTMAMTVFAAVTPLAGAKMVTVNGTNGAIYKFYKVADAVVNGDAYKYSIVEPFSSDSTITPEYLASVTDATDLQSLATRLGDLVGDHEPTKTLTYNAENNTSVELEPGYYLMVADPTGTKLTAANSLFAVLTDEVTLSPKTSDVTMTKKIVDDYNGDNPKDTSTANIGDNIIYRIETTVPSYGAGVTNVKYWITDNPSKGLTIDHQYANIVVKANGVVVDDKNYEVDWNDTDGGFTIKFKSDWVISNGNKVIDTYFTAKLNENAVIGDADTNKIEDYDGKNAPNPDQSYNTGNPNGAKLEYSNNYITGEGSETIKDEVTTFTFKMKVKKVGADAPENGLENAEFTVYNDTACKNVYKSSNFNGILKTGKDGIVVANGFKDGTYYIKETKAPEGYNLYEGTITVKITAGKDLTSGEYSGKYKYEITMDGKNTTKDFEEEKVVVVIDQKGLTLPGTGGMGTTLFTFGGIALILVAGIMFIVYTRKQKKQS